MASTKQQIEDLRRTVDQCSREVEVKRIKLSQCAEELIKWVQKEMPNDPFLAKIPASANPFREKNSFCDIL